MSLLIAQLLTGSAAFVSKGSNPLPGIAAGMSLVLIIAIIIGIVLIIGAVIAIILLIVFLTRKKTPPVPPAPQNTENMQKVAQTPAYTASPDVEANINTRRNGNGN